MVNVNSQGVVPLAGRGYVQRPNGKYQDGEYVELLNTDISDEGTLVSRPSFMSALRAPEILTGFTPDFRRFVGYNGYKPVFDSGGNNPLHQIEQQAVAPNSFLHMATPVEVEVLKGWVGQETGQPNPDYIEIDKYFRYGFKEYLVASVGKRVSGEHWSYTTYVFKADSSEILHDFASSLEYYGTPGTLYPVAIDTHYFDQTTARVNSAPVGFRIKEALVHKDRLWLATKDSVYFSKATDPQKFNIADGGGFFNFPENSINTIVTVQDSLYIFCENSIYMLSYGGDPNVDAVLSKISGTVGGVDAAVYGNEIYTYFNGCIYTISGTNVEMTMDLEINLSDYKPAGSYTGYKFSPQIEVFGNNIYLLSRFLVVRGTDDQPPAWKTRYEHCYNFGYIGFLKISLTNGSVSRYVPANDDWGVAELCPIDNVTLIDAVRVMYFFDTVKKDAYLLPLETKSNQVVRFVDSIRKADNSGFDLFIPQVKIHMQGLVPDKVKALLKRFRSFMVEGNYISIPSSTASNATYTYPGSITFWFTPEEGYAHPSIKKLIHPLKEDISRVYTEQDINQVYRYGLNQRGRQLNYVIESPRVLLQSSIVSQRGDATTFEYTDMRMFWTYIQRGPVGRK